jgi:hypothetical protein
LILRYRACGHQLSTHTYCELRGRMKRISCSVARYAAAIQAETDDTRDHDELINYPRQTRLWKAALGFWLLTNVRFGGGFIQLESRSSTRRVVGSMCHPHAEMNSERDRSTCVICEIHRRSGIDDLIHMSKKRLETGSTCSPDQHLLDVSVVGTPRLHGIPRVYDPYHPRDPQR